MAGRMSTFTLAQSFAIQQNGITSDTVDGEVVIVNLDTGIYYSLTELGAEIWRYLQEHLSLGQIVERVQRRYEADRAKITDGLFSFLRELQEENLVIPAGNGPAALWDPGEDRSQKGAFKNPHLQKYTDLRQIVVMSSINYQNLSSEGSLCDDRFAPESPKS